jgi:predicted alpha/beta superfamily hydrolase
MHPSAAKLRRHDEFHSAYLDHDRDVVVWLPPCYDEGDRRYPVLYMHDGQNLFEPETAFKKGETWRIGETAAELIAAGTIGPMIIAGIYNTGDERADEYTPTRDAKLGGGRADDYGRLIVEELKPLIDRTYRTRPDRESTAMAGSSLGGLVTLYLGFKHPAVFSRIAALSPSVWWDKRAVLKTIRQARSKPPLRIWTDMGTAEGKRGLDDARLLKAALIGLGFREDVDLHYAEYEGATHSERSWSERVAPMLSWLFAKSGSDPDY